MAGTINLASVALGFDSSQITKGVDLSAGEMRKMNQIFKDSISPVDRYNADLHVLEKAHKAGAVSADRMRQAMASLQDKYKQGVPANQGMALPFTELSSAINVVQTGFGALKGSITPVLNEMNRIDAINDQAHKLGMSYRDLNTIQLALGESSGASADDISKAMQKLSIGVTEAIKTGAGAHADALKTLKLDAATIGGMKAVEQLEAITNAMVNIKSQSERLQLTFDLFGKSGAPLVAAFDEGGGKLADMARYADEVGLNLSGPVVEGINNANDSIGRLSMATQGWIAQLSGGAAPALGVIADHMAGAATAGEGPAKLGEQAGGFLQMMYAGANDIYQMSSKPIAELSMADFGRTSFELEMNRIKALEAAKEQSKEKERLAEQSKERSMIEQQEKEAAKKKLELEKEAEDAEKKAAKDKQQEIDKLSKQFEDAHNKRVKEAADLEKATLTPLQEYEKELARISELSMHGAISDDIANAGKDKAGEKLISQAKAADKSDALGVSQTIAPALKSGSVEAYKFMLNQKDKLYEAAQEQKELTSETLEVAKQHLIATQAIPKIGLLR